MKLFNVNSKNVKQLDKPIDLVIGYFDGIHIGHLKLFKQPNTSLLTFVNIPRKTTNLFNFESRLEIYEKLNLDNIYVFDILSNNYNGVEFIEKILKPLNPKKIIVGSNFSFGKDRQSCYLLKKYFDDVEIIDIKNRISTSLIRYWLTAQKPNFKKINSKLTCNYFRSGVVVKSNQDGRKIGIKTANINIESNLIDLIDGVYITKVYLNNIEYPGLTFWGKSETLNHKKPYIETWLINYDGPDFYDQKIKIEFLKFLRKPKKFKSKMKLLTAIKNDLKKTNNFFKIK